MGHIHLRLGKSSGGHCRVYTGEAHDVNWASRRPSDLQSGRAGAKETRSRGASWETMQAVQENKMISPYAGALTAARDHEGQTPRR